MEHAPIPELDEARASLPNEDPRSTQPSWSDAPRVTGESEASYTPGVAP